MNCSDSNEGTRKVIVSGNPLPDGFSVTKFYLHFSLKYGKVKVFRFE